MYCKKASNIFGRKIFLSKQIFEFDTVLSALTLHNIKYEKLFNMNILTPFFS